MFFSIINRPKFGAPKNTPTSPLYSLSMQTLANSLGSGGANGGLNPLYQSGGPRSIELALKLQFERGSRREEAQGGDKAVSTFRGYPDGQARAHLLRRS
jgi:hypothetical protein